MNLKSRINRLNKLISSKQIDPLLEAKIAAIEAEFRSMTDEQLLAIVNQGGDVPGFIQNRSNRELLEILARS
jgi:hypothetical protein